MQEKKEIFYKFLPNGCKIVLHRTKSPVAYVGIMVGAGTRNEAEDESGLAHYIEHCVFKGTEHHTARQLIQRIEGVGGEINAYTTKEETCFYAATPISHWRQTLRLISEMVTCPTFPKHETDKEVGVILDEIESYNDSPSELIYDDFESLLFPGSLGRPILGTRKSLRHISKSPTTPLAFMQREYRPDRIVFFAQGNITIDRLADEIEAIAWSRYITSGSSSQFSTPCEDKSIDTVCSPRTTEPYCQPQNREIVRHTHQTHVLIGSYAYPLGHERQLAAYLLNNILGGGALNSRLNLSLREQHGLVYSVDSQYTPLSNTGYWSIYFACDKEDHNQCIELIQKELHRLRDTELTSSQLQRALTQLHGQMAIGAENQENNVLSMAKHMLYFGEAPSWEDTFARISRLTPADLIDTAQDIYSEERLFSLTYR